MTPDDIDGVVGVARLSFPDHFEARACFVERLAEQAKAAGWSEIALVAVNEATAFWERNGFVVQTPPGMAEKLASYGDDARYMIRTL